MYSYVMVQHNSQIEPLHFVSMCMLETILSYKYEFVGAESSRQFSTCSMLVQLTNLNCIDRFPGLWRISCAP